MGVYIQEACFSGDVYKVFRGVRIIVQHGDEVYCIDATRKAPSRRLFLFLSIVLLIRAMPFPLLFVEF